MLPGRFSFLVTGAGRGGTSLLAGLLGTHPDLDVAFETHMPHLMGLVPESAENAATRLSTFRSACDQSAAASGKIWGIKITTEQIWPLAGEDTDASFRLFYDYHSDLKHVFILRDGRTCVRSKNARNNVPLETGCVCWLYSAKIYRHFEAGRVNGIAIKFEHLVHDPVATLNRVCDFLGVPYDEAMLKGTDHRGMLPEYRQTGFDPAPTQITPLDEHLLFILEPELRACGYLPASAEPSARQRLTDA